MEYEVPRTPYLVQVFINLRNTDRYLYFYLYNMLRSRLVADEAHIFTSLAGQGCRLANQSIDVPYSVRSRYYTGLHAAQGKPSNCYVPKVPT
jgi:hypothetical protein